jgi:purine-nucleoside/S-methyl-5'-thioadenosine phosphorylase / adenosine deaminase
MQWRSEAGVRWLEAELPGGRAAFTTRLGGSSRPPFDSLNLGILTDDDRDAVSANRARLAEALGLEPADVVIGRQVHGAELAHHRCPQRPSPYAVPGSELPEVDGHATATPELPQLVFVADCLPVALAGPGGIAMLHCGWRGLAAGIVAEGARAVGATAAAIGPGIGPCCYEVGREVIAGFAGLGEGIATGRMLDLPEAARRLLERAGVERIEVAGLCTSCEEELFFSHRRDRGRTGRQAGLAWLEGGG